MRRLLQSISVGFFLLVLLSAQERNPTEVFLENYRRELAFREFDQQRSHVDREIALRRHAQYLEVQFIAKVNRFAALWGELVRDYNQKRAFNIKIAGEVTKAFHEIETSEGWLKTVSKSKR